MNRQTRNRIDGEKEKDGKGKEARWEGKVSLRGRGLDRAPNHPINTSRREQRHLFGPDCIANKTQVVSREEKRKEGRKEGKEKR